MGDERNKALTETRFNLPADREVCHLLEQWFSLKILNGNQLCNLPAPGAFVDICCQVLAFNKSPCCINAVIWDTTKPKYAPFFGPDGRLPQGLESINYDYFQVAYERYFPLNIWKEENNDQAQHYDTFRCVDLTTADDLVVMFNLQVVEDHNHPGNISLVMRSSRKWGKAVRLCHRNSILGKMFLKKCQEYRQTFRQKLGILDLVEDSPKTPKKQKTNEEASSSKTKSVLDPKPSTSRYALRSHTRITATEPSENGLQNHEKSTKKTEECSLTHLLNKSKGILDWDVLLSNGLDGLSLLKETIEEELALNESFPLTRIEYLQLIKLAIEHLKAQ
uniref:Protection of telomeres protein 1 ssDNA-binding domain-containing protein n=1 Tax=Tetranychus urticae TaxID=32264 RepID=T1KPL5_TETUR